MFRQQLKLQPFAIVALLAIASPAAAQIGRPFPDSDFFDDGLEQFEEEIENFERINRGDDLLTVETTGGGWEAFESDIGRFTIAFPQDPIFDNPVLETPTANLPLTRFVSAEEVQTFVLAYGDYPETADIGNPQATLAEVQAAIANGLGVEVSEETEIALGDYPGRELNFDLPNGSLMFRLYLVDDRVYLLGTERPGDSEISGSTARFFDSFQLLEPES